MEVHASREAASRAAAEVIAMRDNDMALNALSGGSTPNRCYELLAAEHVSWHRRKFTVTDERCVPLEHPARNTFMLRSHLPAAAQIMELEVFEGSQRLDIAMLGMGEDGHFASIFPDSAQCEQALDLSQPPGVLRVETPASEHPRITLNLSAIVTAQQILLLIFGETKRALLEHPGNLPIAHLLNQAPVRVIWAP